MKITERTTLYEMQEFCKNSKENCMIDCDFYDAFTDECRFMSGPQYWQVQKKKTYIDVFKEKFPRLKNKNIYQNCIKALLGEHVEGCDGHCKKCWEEPVTREEFLDKK